MSGAIGHQAGRTQVTLPIRTWLTRTQRPSRRRVPPSLVALRIRGVTLARIEEAPLDIGSADGRPSGLIRVTEDQQSRLAPQRAFGREETSPVPGDPRLPQQRGASSSAPFSSKSVQGIGQGPARGTDAVAQSEIRLLRLRSATIKTYGVSQYDFRVMLTTVATECAGFRDVCSRA
ncbi:hypothetical protein D9M72_472160 [compost metagenome]